MTDPKRVDDDPRVAALLRWREQLIDAGAVSAGVFKEAHVRLVLRSGRTEVEQIRAMLPGAVAEHAEEMARVLQDVDRDAHRAGAGSDPTLAVSVPQTGFAPYLFGPAAHEVTRVRLRSIPATDDQPTALEVSWAPFPAETASCVIYRLTSTEEHPGYSPDSATQVAVTTATTASDSRPLVGAARHLQVWVNVGASEAEALAAQPVLHAAGAVIVTPRDYQIREDSGRVIGRWTVPPGVDAVHVYRLPAESVDAPEPPFRIMADQPNLTGFVDHEAERGRRYLYRMRCEVVVDGVVRLSEAVSGAVTVSAVREPVRDLTLSMHSERDGAEFDLEWTPPRFGTVLLFRTPEPPSADAQDSELAEAVLDQVGLTRDVQLTHPVADRVDADGAHKSVMASVPWPGDWTRAYFTPVTVLDGRARLGRSTSMVRAGLIHDPALMEYCDKQVLTFDWPEGAASVLVYIAPKGHDPRDGLTGRSYGIARADYEKYGGLQFLGDLPNRGCSLHLVPVAFTGGHRVLGVPTSIEYRGLLRMWYDVQILREPTGFPLSAAVRIRAETETAGSPPFVLVNNPERLPLSIGDGAPVDMFRVDAEGKPLTGRAKEFQWADLTGSTDEVWAGDARGLQGWIRLFANVGPHRLQTLALLDPPVAALCLTPGMAPT
ncbi:MAG TPA: hypothetical protein VL179_14675 [Mycobacterium sp.]|nr:hypothetical protein [Mycobacterium sp.]